MARGALVCEYLPGCRCMRCLAALPDEQEHEERANEEPIGANAMSQWETVRQRIVDALYDAGEHTAAVIVGRMRE